MIFMILGKKMESTNAINAPPKLYRKIVEKDVPLSTK